MGIRLPLRLIKARIVLQLMRKYDMLIIRARAFVDLVDIYHYLIICRGEPVEHPSRQIQVGVLASLFRGLRLAMKEGQWGHHIGLF